MIEITILERLRQDSVTVTKSTIVTVGEKTLEAARESKAYSNSNSLVNGRTVVQAEVVEPYLTAIMAVWGDSPAVEITNLIAQ